MFKISVSTTRSAMFCLAAACFASIASTAQADVIGAVAIGSTPAAVSDALLGGARAANLRPNIVTNVVSPGPAAVVPVNAAITIANGVRLWDEVIPPAPAPKPAQASLSSPGQSRTTLAVSQIPQIPQLPQTSSAGVMTTSFKVNASATRMPSAAVR
ncbi:hypothetical protein [Pandoraea sp. NPDC087047]|uniref:hypothetical protein n=1 Tax=Pandoraea sp. NPDC087047 TaxID=3364390 RepID=UPI003803FBE5